MLEKIVTSVLQKYLYQYLKNFDQKNLNISLLRGRIDLKNLELNQTILKNLPFPVKLKYGRVGSINIALPSLMNITNPVIKVAVSDIFICLTIKPTEEWDPSQISSEYHDDRRQLFSQLEEDATNMFEEYKGDEDKMNNYILKLIQNVHVDISKIYIRLEDPISMFAIGLTLPSIKLASTDSEWNLIDLVKNDAEVMRKMIQANQFQIFLDYGDPDEILIDKLIGVDNFQGTANFDELIQQMLQQHTDKVFSGAIKSKYILQKFYIDIRFMLILDKQRVLEKDPQYSGPDISLKFLLGDLYTNLSEEEALNWLNLRVDENQLHSLIKFFTYVGLYNQFRVGILHKILDKPLDLHSEEIQDYINIHENYLNYRLQNDEEGMTSSLKALSKIEKSYRIDLIQMLRKLVHERFYGMQRANHVKLERLREIASSVNQMKSEGIMSMLPIFGKRESKKVQAMTAESLEEGLRQRNDEQINKELKKIDFAYKFIKVMYAHRYKNGMDDLEHYSKLRHDIFFTFTQNKTNFITELQFKLPKLQLQVFKNSRGQSKDDFDKSIIDLVIEGLDVGVYSESKSQYQKISVNLENLYIYDHHSKTPNLPYFIQTVLPEHMREARHLTVMEIVYENNPEQSQIATHRLKFHNKGQLNIYANLDFATTLTLLTIQLINDMTESHRSMIIAAKSNIQIAANKGSFYQEMLSKTMEEKQEQIYEALERISHGNYEPPSLDLDIQLKSPQLILYEPLMCSNHYMEDHPVALIVDLGTIHVTTELVRKSRAVDYEQCEDSNLLYNKMVVKFGNLNATIDYDLQFIKMFSQESRNQKTFEHERSPRTQKHSVIQFEKPSWGLRKSQPGLKEHHEYVEEEIKISIPQKNDQLFTTFHYDLTDTLEKSAEQFDNIQLGKYKSANQKYQFNIQDIQEDNFSEQVNGKKSKIANWRMSQDCKIKVIENLSFGIEIKTSLVPFHKIHPSQIINCKFNNIKLNLSQKVIQSIYIFENVFFASTFWGKLQLLMNLPPTRPIDIKDENGNVISAETLKFDIMNDQEKEKELQRRLIKSKVAMKHHDSDQERARKSGGLKEGISLLQTVKRVVFDETIQDVKQKYKSERFDEAKKSVIIQVNLIFPELRASYQDLLVIRKGQIQNQNHDTLITSDIFEISISGIRGQLNFQPKVKTDYRILLEKLLITYKDPEQENLIFKHLILNPKQTDRAQRQSSSNNFDFRTQSYIQNLYKNIHRSQTKTHPENEVLQIDFYEFSIFSPRFDVKDFTRQLEINLKQVDEIGELDIFLGKIELVFIVPLIQDIYLAYTEAMKDMYSYEKLVTDKMDAIQGKKSSTTQFNLKEFQLKSKLTRQKSIAGDQTNRASANKNQFVLDKAYTNFDQNAKDQSPKRGSETKASIFAKQATRAMKLNNDPRKQNSLLPQLQDPNIPEIFEMKKKTLKSFLNFKAESIEVTIPSNLHEEDTLCLKLNLKSDVEICRRSYIQDTHKKDSQKTWVETMTLNETSHMSITLKDLSIFMTNQGKSSTEAQLDYASSLNHKLNPTPEKIFLLHPYEIKIVIDSYTEVVSELQAYTKTRMAYESDLVLNLTVGLCELNSYLLLGQLTFSLLNEIMAMNKSIEEKQKECSSSKHIENQDQSELRKTQSDNQADNRRLELEEILKNENLIQNKKQSAINKWKRAGKLAVASVQRRDFYEVIQVFNLQKGVCMQFVDNVSMQNLALISVHLGLKKLYLESRGFEVPTVYKMEHLFQIERIREEKRLLFFKLDSEMILKGTYFNRANYFEEPFLEEYPFVFRMKQQTPMSKQKQLLQSKNMLNINFTFGMACNLQKLIKTILQMEAQFKHGQEQNQDADYHSQSQSQDFNVQAANNHQPLNSHSNQPSTPLLPPRFTSIHYDLQSKELEPLRNLLAGQKQSSYVDKVSQNFLQNNPKLKPRQSHLSQISQGFQIRLFTPNMNQRRARLSGNQSNAKQTKSNTYSYRNQNDFSQAFDQRNIQGSFEDIKEEEEQNNRESTLQQSFRVRNPISQFNQYQVSQTAGWNGEENVPEDTTERRRRYQGQDIRMEDSDTDLNIPNEKLNHSIDMPPERQVQIRDIFFHNHTGLRVLICLSVFRNLLKYKRSKAVSDDYLLDELNFNQNSDIKCLEPQDPLSKSSLILDFAEFTEPLRQHKGIDQEMNSDQRLSASINFKIHGFKRVRHLVLQRNGVFGFYLINQHRRKRDFLGSESSQISCIVRIKRKDEDIHVHFESNLIFQNETDLDLELRAINMKNESEADFIKLRSGNYHHSKIQWQVNKTLISLMKQTQNDQMAEELIRKINKLLNPNLIKPRKDPSKWIQIGRRYIAMDLYYLKTATNIGQFLIVFTPIITIHNLLFTEVCLDYKRDSESDIKESITIMHLHTNQTKTLMKFNPYSKNENECIMKNRVSENEYFESRVCLSLSKVIKYKGTFFKHGIVVKLTPRDSKDQTRNVTSHVVLERVDEIPEFKVHKYENFNLRSIVYKKVKSVYFKLYAPYVAVNRTEDPIFIYDMINDPTSNHSSGELYMNPTSSLLIAPLNRRARIRVEEYGLSKPFLINTLGISGTIQQIRERVKPIVGPKSSLSMEEQEQRRSIEIGTYISSCPHPYSRTKVIKFQPRYRVVNQIGLVIVLMQEGSDYQMPIMPNDEVTLNLISGQENYLRVRLIDIESEAKKIEDDPDREIQQEEYKGKLTEKFRNMTDRKLTNEQNDNLGNTLKLLNERGLIQSGINQTSRNQTQNQPIQIQESIRLTSPLQANMNGEGDNCDDQIFNDDRRIVMVNKRYAQSSKDDFQVWSYKFPVKDLDDFQLAVPNKVNSMKRLVEHSKGWQENDDKFFVRVNISPSSENDATIYISFSYPMYPDYVFFNDTQYRVTVQHDPELNGQSKNEITVIPPESKDVIVLNPLLIKFFSPESENAVHQFIYEIDSMDSSSQMNEVESWHIYTKATLNLRFVHLMTREDYVALREREETEQAQFEQEHQESLAELDNFRMELNLSQMSSRKNSDRSQKSNRSNRSNSKSPHRPQNRKSLFRKVKSNDQSNGSVNKSGLGIRSSLRQRNESRTLALQDHRNLDKQIEEEKEILEEEALTFMRQKKVEEFTDDFLESSLVEMRVDIEGLGISLVDHQPRELCYISVYKPRLLQVTKYTKNKQGIEHTHRQINFKLVNLQIDNMTPRSFPVILGPKQSLCFIERQYRELQNQKELERVSVRKTKTAKALKFKQVGQNTYEFEEEKAKEKLTEQKTQETDRLNSLDDVCFLQLQLDNESFTDKKLTTQKINHFRVALTEIAINFHQYFLNRMLAFINSITTLIPDEELAQFTQSQTMANYNQLFELIINQEKQVILRQDGQNAIEDLDSIEEDDLNFLRQTEKEVPQIQIFQEDIENLENQDLENALFKSYQQSNLEQLRRASMMRTKRNFKQKFKRIDKVCTFLSADPIKYSKGQGIVSSKILVKEIAIKALKIYLTFRVSKIETQGAGGLGNGVLNFFMNFANVSDAQLYFTEIEIYDAYTSLEDVQTRLMKHYIKQGIEQLYQVFGATDIIGNPVSLVNNLGRGVEQLYSQPFKGALSSQGNALTTVVGLKDGIKDFAKIATGGISNSVAKMSGTWYMSLANLSGRQISESNLDDPNSFPSGLYQGSKGLVLELSQGVTGIVKVPMRRVREEGRGFRQVAKGAVQGVFGLMTAPFNGVLKFIHSTTAGTRNQVEGTDSSKVNRHRYPRSFNEMQIMNEYEGFRSHAHAALITVEGGLYKNENIHIFADISEKLKGPKSRFKERILICTDERIMLVQGLNKIKGHLELKSLAQIKYVLYIVQETNVNEGQLGGWGNQNLNTPNQAEINSKCGFNSNKVILERFSSEEINMISKQYIQNDDNNPKVDNINSKLEFRTFRKEAKSALSSNYALAQNEQSSMKNLIQQKQLEISQTQNHQLPPLQINEIQSQMPNPSKEKRFSHSILEMQLNQKPLQKCNIVLIARSGKTQLIKSHRINQCRRFVQRVALKLNQLKHQQEQELLRSSQAKISHHNEVVTQVIAKSQSQALMGGGTGGT